LLSYSIKKKQTNHSLFQVEGGHRAVIFDRFAGINEEVIGEGTHFMVPWLHRPIIFDIRTRPRSVAVSTGSKDLQTINISLRTLYRPRADSLPKIYTNLGLDYEERVLPSIINEVLKAVVVRLTLNLKILIFKFAF
jgi:prohibitin 1